MAQPAQIFTPVIGSGHEYSVIDNGAAPTFPTLNAGAQFGYDLTVDVPPFRGGAVDQSQNGFTNGNIPDFVASGKTFTCATNVIPVPSIISYKLPS